MCTFNWRSVVALCFALVLALPCLGDATPDDVVEKTRLEKMLADGDTGMIAQVFRRYSSRTLPFIDQYLEGGLARIEKGEDPSNVLDQYRTGIRFAEIADKAFGVFDFGQYANSFASWSPTEQKNFREGQKAYRSGVKDSDPKTARQSLETSLSLARSLGDLWGQAMAHQALAEAAFNAGEYRQALAMAIQAVDQYSRLQMKQDCAQAFRMAGKAALRTEQPTSAVSYYSQAWTMVERDPDTDAGFRELTIQEYVEALETLGLKDRADALRKEHSMPAEGEVKESEPAMQ